MKSILELQNEANRLRQMTEVSSISPEDTFGLQRDTIDYLADMERNSKSIGIRKTYPSVAAMLADGEEPIGSNGKPLLFGQLVAICDVNNSSNAENGFIYAYQNNNDNPWLLVGNINNVNEAEAELIAETIMQRLLTISKSEINNITNS